MRDVSRSPYAFRALLLALLLSTTLAAAAGPQPDLDRWTVDGGGGTSRGGTYVLDGTIGQAEAGAGSSGAPYTLSGGFWGDAAQRGYVVYLPLVVTAYP
jgi:hypothetical protein